MGIWIDGFTGFGLFTLITNFISIAGSKSKEHNENKKCFKRTYNPKTDTYLDMYCVERRPNGDYCRTMRDPVSGDLIQKDINGKIIRNFSKEERIKMANENESTVIKMSEFDMTGSDYVDIKGVRYIDKQTGEEYVIRMFPVQNENSRGLVYFYMKTSDLSLVRITDGEKKYGLFKDMDAINAYIEKYNREQPQKDFLNDKERYHNARKSDRDREFKFKHRVSE